MKRLILPLALAMSLNVSAQYTITLQDKTRLTVDSPMLTFSEDSLELDDMRVSLAEIATLTAADPDAPKPYVIAYHPYYSNVQPPVDKVTHINYSFAEVYVRDNVYQGFKLQGTQNAFNKTLALKNSNPDLKILLSFTHTVVNSDNHQDGGFSAIAAVEDSRREFAEDCLEFMQTWNLDGIDMDWEFPGLSWSGAACDPENDVDNFTLLLKQMRETFGPDYLLTFAGYCMDKRSVNGGWRYIDLAAVEPYVDYVNIMTYDLDEAPRFHNAVKSPSSYRDIERTFTAYRNAGFPLEKVLLGIPFYVRHTFASSAVRYGKLYTLKESDGYKIDNWSEQAQVPYVTLNGTMWGSYDNERSIAAKARYSATAGLLGLFYWCDYEDDTNQTLARATWRSAMLYMR